MNELFVKKKIYEKKVTIFSKILAGKGGCSYSYGYGSRRDRDGCRKRHRNRDQAGDRATHSLRFLNTFTHSASILLVSC